MSASKDTGDKLSFVTDDERKKLIDARRVKYETWSQEELVEHIVRQQAEIKKLKDRNTLLEDRARFLKNVADLDVGKAECLTFNEWLRRELQKEPPGSPSSSCK